MYVTRHQFFHKMAASSFSINVHVFIFYLVAKIWRKEGIQFMNSTAAIFDFITLEVEKKITTLIKKKSLSHSNAESSGSLLLTNT